MHEAQFYIKENATVIKCLLCPHRCIIKEGRYGKCNVRVNRSGSLYSENYGRVAGLNFDPVEKKPLYHFYPGWQIQSIGTFGCNLRCDFCQNYHMSQAARHSPISSRFISPADIVDLTLTKKGCCGISYTYNEPFVWYEYMTDIAKTAKEKGLANAVVSNGYINPEPLDRLLDIIDGFNIDLKAFSDDFYRKLTGATLEPVKTTLKTIAKYNIHIEIANLIIPGLNDDPAMFEKMTEWIAGELGTDTPLHINRYFPCYKLNIDQTPIETIMKLRNTALEKLNFVYCGNISSLYGESDTICPGCKKTVISRSGYIVCAGQLDEKGCCMNCNYKIVVC